MVEEILTAGFFVTGDESLGRKSLSSRPSDRSKDSRLEEALIDPTTAPARMPRETRKREMNEAVGYAVGNGIRNQALAILAEGARSSSELAKIMGLGVKRVSNHVKELYECGCIEIASTAKKGNITEVYYRAVILPYITDEAYRRMSMEERHDVNGVTTQNILNEMLAAYRAGKMDDDDDLWLLWDALMLDKQGRREVAQELEESYERLKDIAGHAATRLCESGEVGETTIVTAAAFDRCRSQLPEQRYTPPTES
jgi:DNA-binding transcriptional ArsR family regulator